MLKRTMFHIWLTSILAIFMSTNCQGEDFSIIAHATSGFSRDPVGLYDRQIIRISIDVAKTTAAIHSMTQPMSDLFLLSAKRNFLLLKGRPKTNNPPHVSDIYITRYDGSADKQVLKQLSELQKRENVSDFKDFQFSSDANKIVFTAVKSHRYHSEFFNEAADAPSSAVFIYNIGTNNVIRLVPYGYCCELPAFSPDGKWIAFFRSPLDANVISGMIDDRNFPCRTPCIVPTTGGKVIEIAKPGYILNTGTDQPPAWSPDSQKILFEAQYDKMLPLGKQNIPPGIFMADLNSFAVERLTPAKWGHNAYYPSWSPDGNKFCFLGNKKLKVMDFRTRQTSVLIDGVSLNQCAWAPEGNLIAYVESNRGNLSIISDDNHTRIDNVYKLNSGFKLYWVK